MQETGGSDQNLRDRGTATVPHHASRVVGTLITERAFTANDPANLTKPAQWQAGWREGCRGELARGSAVGPTSSCWSVRERRDNSPGLWTQGAVMCNEPGRRTRALAMRGGTRCRGSCAAGFGNGAKINIMAIVSGDAQSKASPQARNEVSTVGDAGASCQQVPNEAQLVSRGRTVFTNFFHSIRAACERSEIQSACLRCFSDRNGAQ